MIATRITAKIVDDNSGVPTELPIILTDQGPIPSVIDFLLEKHLNGASISTLNKDIQSIILLIEYMEANQDVFDDPEVLFQAFARRLYSGTVGEDGIDPSGLFWVPSSQDSANRHISRISQFTDWMADKNHGVRLNRLRKATPHEERLAYAAWWRRNQNDFLGHIKDRSISSTVKHARSLRGKTKLTKADDDAIAFPETKLKRFYLEGIGGAKDPRVAMRDKLILLLMHGAGLRESEALLLWVTDVFEDPDDPERALVRIYSETEGVAPNNWKSRKGSKSRTLFLKEQYGRVPRVQMVGTEHLGWKSRVTDHKDGYLAVYFFPVDYAKLFMSLWQTYSKYRAAVDAHHPYAFISFDSRNIGRPYTANACNQSYATGLRRIGLQPNKTQGLDPHGHRHNYGRRLTEAGVDPLIIKKCLHHKQIGSQEVYTSPGQKRVSEMLSHASAKLALPDNSLRIRSTDWKSLVEHGFDDIDPHGYFSGKKPRLGRAKNG